MEVLVALRAQVIEINMRVHVFALGAQLCVELFGLFIILSHLNIIIRKQDNEYYKKRGLETVIATYNCMLNSLRTL